MAIKSNEKLPRSMQKFAIDLKFHQIVSQWKNSTVVGSNPRY